MTPLPGVSAPAGLRPSPLAPLFAAAQPWPCPAPAGKAGHLSLSHSMRGKIDRIWNSADRIWNSAGRIWNSGYPTLKAEGPTFDKKKATFSWAHLLLDLPIGGLHNYLLPGCSSCSGVLLHGFDYFSRNNALWRGKETCYLTFIPSRSHNRLDQSPKVTISKNTEVFSSFVRSNFNCCQFIDDKSCLNATHLWLFFTPNFELAKNNLYKRAVGGIKGSLHFGTRFFVNSAWGVS